MAIFLTAATVGLGYACIAYRKTAQINMYVCGQWHSLELSSASHAILSNLVSKPPSRKMHGSIESIPDISVIVDGVEYAVAGDSLCRCIGHDETAYWNHPVFMAWIQVARSRNPSPDEHTLHYFEFLLLRK